MLSWYSLTCPRFLGQLYTKISVSGCPLVSAQCVRLSAGCPLSVSGCPLYRWLYGTHGNRAAKSLAMKLGGMDSGGSAARNGRKDHRPRRTSKMTKFSCRSTLSLSAYLCVCLSTCLSARVSVCLLISSPPPLPNSLSVCVCVSLSLSPAFIVICIIIWRFT